MKEKACPEEMQMKQTVRMVMAVVLFIIVLSFAQGKAEAAEAVASGTCGENLSWVLDDEGTLTISGSGAMEDYDYWTESERPAWYEWRSQVNKIIVKEGVTTIGRHAFWDMWKASEVSLPNGLISIGDQAFDQCAQLTEINFPESLETMGYCAFFYCKKLAEVSIPQKVVSLDVGVFWGCTGLKKVFFSDGITHIDSWAFKDCSEELVFYGYASSVVEGYAAAYGFEFNSLGLAAPIEVTGVSGTTWTFYNYEMNVSARTSYLSFDDYLPVKKLIVSDGVYSVEIHEPSVECIVLPDSVRVINCTDCTGLKGINLPLGVTSINFQGCTSLDNVVIPNSVRDIIYANKFENCTSLSSINIHGAISEIGEAAFRGCSNLNVVSLPTWLEKIGDYAFENCTKLTEIRIPENVTTIGIKAFGYQDGVANPEFVVRGVEGSAAQTYALENGLRFVAEESELVNVVAGGICGQTATWQLDNAGTLTISGSGAMDDYKDIGSIYTEDVAPWYAYRKQIFQLEIGERITSIGEYAFAGVANVEKVVLPDGVLEIGESAFLGCNALTKINIPSGVTVLEHYVFMSCHSLQEIQIPSGVTKIETWAFMACRSLSRVNFSDALRSIGANAFLECSALTDVELPEGIIEIGQSAFVNTAIGGITIPKSVTTISDRAFGYTGSELVDGYVIYGYKDSAAEYYANENGITFICLHEKSTPEYAIPEGLTATYGDMLSSVEIPAAENGVFTWINGNQTVGAAGENTFLAVFTPNDTENYTAVSNVQITIKVEQAIPIFTVPTGLTATYGDELSSVKLPETEEGTFSWRDENQEVGDAGINRFCVTYTPTDSVNYKVISDIGVEITVAPKKADLIEIPVIADREYDPTITLRDIELPVGWSWYDDTIVPTVGNAGYKATYTPEDTKNYDYSGQMLSVVLAVNVEKAVPMFDVPTGLTATYGDVLSSVKLPETEEGVFSWQGENQTVGETGINGFYVTYTPVDSANYKVISDIKIEITVVPQKAEQIEIPVIGDCEYDPTVTLGDIVLPAGWSWDDATIVPTVGNTGYRATYTPVDAKNYDYSEQDLNPILTVNVKKAVPMFSVPTGLMAKYEDVLSSVKLPEAENGVFYWENDDQSVGDVGENSFNAIFVPNDQSNYDVVKDVAVMITVAAKIAEQIEVPILADRDYDPEVTLGDIELPEGWSWDDETIVPTVINSGYRATYTPADTKNYDYSAQNLNPVLTVTVKKAKPKYVVPVGLAAEYGTMLSTVALLSAEDGEFFWNDGNQNVGEVGARYYYVTFTPDDTENYKVVRNIVVAVTVVPKSVESLEIPSVADRVYDPAITLGDIELPEGWSWDEETIVPTVGNDGYKATYTPADQKNYDYSGVDLNPFLSVEVEPADPVYVVPSGMTAVYGDILASIALPEIGNGVFVWSDETQAVGEVGANYFSVKFTPNDANNYKAVEGINVLVTVSPKVAELVAVPVIADRVYDPAITLGDIVLPEGWSWDDATVVPTVGNTGYKATYTPEDSKNYDYSAQNLNPTLKIAVEKAMPMVDIPVGLSAMEGDLLSEVLLPEGFCWTSGDQFVDEPGNKVFLAEYIPEDTVNFHVVENIQIPVCVTEWSAGEGVSVIASGFCGEDVRWTLDNTGMLTISGTGPMDDYGYASAPWNVWRGSVKRIVVRQGVTRIGDYAFFNCASLTGIFLPESLVEIGNYSFDGCSNLMQIELPANLKAIGTGAFLQCEKLKEITIPDGVQTIYRSTFGCCYGLRKVVFPKGLKSISEGALEECSTDLVLYGCSSSVVEGFASAEGFGFESIGLAEPIVGACGTTATWNFYNYCMNVVGSGDAQLAFSRYFPVEQLNVSEGITGIYGLYLPNIKRIVLPDSVYYFWFTDFTGLTEINIPRRVTRIANDGLKNCSSLPKIDIPATVRLIDESAFYGCTSLASVSLSEGLETISHYAFENCPALKEIAIPKSVTYIGLRALGYLNGEKITDFVIKGVKGTQAEVYARENGFRFIEVMDEKYAKIKAFAERLYTKALGRASDEAGVGFWTEMLVSEEYTAAQAAVSFIFGPEFVGQNNSNEVFLDRLYATFFDRAADEGGKAYWLSYLDNGVTREYVTAQFVNSAEFEAVCAEYGMQRGSIGLSGYVNFNPNLTMYVVRCYREIHGREADSDGLEYWCEMIATKQRDATHVARSFVDSQEFIEKNLPNEEYLEVLYRAFMGRSSDPSGLAYWLGELERGCTRMEVLDRFADCEEFDLILESFGL